MLVQDLEMESAIWGRQVTSFISYSLIPREINSHPGITPISPKVTLSGITPRYDRAHYILLRSLPHETAHQAITSTGPEQPLSWRASCETRSWERHMPPRAGSMSVEAWE